ncbi:MAG TPA: 3'(2'),5'-bisphosphate nucleotidase CysQ [Arenicellales bacterium]|nr:3'(2'),5'-bisphosphate nucleotidase CysQ [Arenicellales bacterium]
MTDVITQEITREISEALIKGVVRVGRRVLAICHRGFTVEKKADDSPLTEADLLAHRELAALLARLTPEVPLLSEESEPVLYDIRRRWRRYWLVDPIDGTKEFVNRTDEFTLNVALIEDGAPVFGAVHAPVAGVTWVGQRGRGAWRLEGDRQRNIWVRPLPARGAAPWKILGSRAHGVAAFDTFCARLPAHERRAMGSSLKLCLVAEGEADLYPRFAPTSEWDTAAAQAVVTAAGGGVLDAHTLEPLRYNQQESLLNPSFIVCGQRDERWELALRAALEQPSE